MGLKSLIGLFLSTFLLVSCGSYYTKPTITYAQPKAIVSVGYLTCPGGVIYEKAYDLDNDVDNGYERFEYGEALAPGQLKPPVVVLRFAPGAEGRFIDLVVTIPGQSPKVFTNPMDLIRFIGDNPCDMLGVIKGEIS